MRRWGHPRARDVGDWGSTTLTLRPRRAGTALVVAPTCLLVGAVLPRRADTTAVIATTLQASARGIGYRRIAVELRRPTSTVGR